MHGQTLGQMHRTVIVCVDSYCNGVPVGRFFHPESEGVHGFQSLTQFLTEMECTLDEVAFPHSYNMVRTFGPVEPQHHCGVGAGGGLQGRLATFAVRVLFRQNTSWQGSVRWLEANREQSFRSALELILLVDSVLSGKETHTAC